MTSHRLDEERIFHTARLLPTTTARNDYLDQICAGDQALRERVEQLLECHEEDQGLLRSSTREPAPTVDLPSTLERVGTTIGRYKLMEQVGEGGMGTVFVAQQERPIRRKVAFKVIKPGMDTKSVIARFEAERQALAMMDHPNIAKVLDAGTTDSGRPYFAMELVKGVPITQYCDTNRLSVSERLALFCQVCQAVQHAHQKGIIHRDIKPSNVLVTLHDGQPVPKVIDFGVAKALSARLTDKTIYTEHLQVIGTLLYMSPEQAELSGLDVDTRSDVYSLGVLLYELLTGTTPFPRDELDKAGFDEQRRILRDQDPPRASVRISSLGESATEVAEHRRTDPKKLHQCIRGDLDWIVLKALEKDRTRRFDSARDLGLDVERFLKHELVEARPPSTAYRMRKLAFRHRVALGTSFAIVAVLVIGLVSTSLMGARWRASLTKLRESAYEQAILAVLLGDQAGSSEALETARDAGVPQVDLKVLNGMALLIDGQHELAVREAQEVLASDNRHVGAQALLAHSRLWSGYVDEWVSASSKLADLKPQSDADRLLMATALVLHDSELALRLLRGNHRLERSPIGLLIRAQDRAMRAEDEQSTSLIQKALLDYQYLQWLLPENSNLAGWQMAALATGIEFARRDGQSDADLVSQAEQLLRRTPIVEHDPFLEYCRWQLCRTLGREPDAIAAVRRGGKHGWFCWFVAADSLQRHGFSTAALTDFEQAMKNGRNDKYVRLAKAYLVHDSPNGAAQVRELAGRLADGEANVTNQIHILCALCLTGDLEAVRYAASQFNSVSDKGSDRHASSACLEFLRDPTEDAEARLLTQAPENGYAAVNVHFSIGMVRLARGDRRGAQASFEECTQQIILGNIAYEMALAMLACMRKDSEWPHWLNQRVNE